MKQKTYTETSADLNDRASVISTRDEQASFANLSSSLAEIRNLKGVTGYILRSETSAIIDIAEQDKIIDYAILTSQVSESSVELTKQFNLPQIESVLIEAKNVKVLCMSVGENKIGIFMDRTATHDWIIKRILL